MRVLDEIWNGKNPALVLCHAEESSRRILKVNEKIRLTKDVACTAGFTAGTMVMVHEVRFSPMTPPAGMAAENYLSAVYKIATIERYQERQDVSAINSSKVPHASLSYVQGGTPSSNFYLEGEGLFLIRPFTYKHRGSVITLPPGTPVKPMSPGAMTEKGSKSWRPETSVYEVTKQQIVTKERAAVVAAMPVPKIYFE